MNPWFYIPPKVLRLPVPRHGQIARPGQMTMSQKTAAHAVLVMTGWGRTPLLLNYGMIADAIHRYGCVRFGPAAVSRAIKGYRHRGVYRPGLQANGWVVIGTYPGTRMRAVMPSDALLDLCDLPADWRDRP